VLEAFAYGTPVVATAVGGVPDMLDDDSGWLVPPGDRVSFARALHDALQSRPEAEQRAALARRLLMERFTVEKQAEAWLTAASFAVGDSRSQ
jgi:glycosyltransferase involved in cell wall biosynthesis